MLSEFSYPIICTSKFVETVNYYEDFLNFTPVMEMTNYVVLKRNDWENSYLAILDTSHPDIPAQYLKEVSGMILNYPVMNTDQAYDDFYWEGMNIVSDVAATPCHKRRFFIEDPNGILIAVGENTVTSYTQDDLQKVWEDAYVSSSI